MSGAINDAQHGFGVSRVPRKPSVRIEIRRFGFFFRASRIVSIFDHVNWVNGRWAHVLHTSSCSFAPKYRVDKYIRRLAFDILSYFDAWLTNIPYGNPIGTARVAVVLTLRTE
jgi:hypothetical protein